MQATTHARHDIEDISVSSFDSALHVSRYRWVRDTWCKPEDRVLDLGCGTGFGVAILSEVAGDVVGVDFADEALAVALARHPAANVRFVKADLTAPSLVDVVGGSCFDLVTSMETIEHLEDYFTFVASAAAALRPDGMFVVGTPNRRVTYDRFPDRRHMDTSHVQEFTRTSLAHVLDEHFESVEMHFQSIPGYWEAKARAVAAAPSARAVFANDWLPPKLTPSIREAVGRVRRRPVAAAPTWSLADVEITSAADNPDRESEAFCLLAVCRHPR